MSGKIFFYGNQKKSSPVKSNLRDDRAHIIFSTSNSSWAKIMRFKKSNKESSTSPSDVRVALIFQLVLCL